MTLSFAGLAAVVAFVVGFAICVPRDNSFQKTYPATTPAG